MFAISVAGAARIPPSLTFHAAQVAVQGLAIMSIAVTAGGQRRRVEPPGGITQNGEARGSLARDGQHSRRGVQLKDIQQLRRKPSNRASAPRFFGKAG